MKTRHLLAIIFTLVSVNVFAGVETLYFVGGFNGWDIGRPEVVAIGTDGLFETVIDFSGNQDFKVSTVNPQGDWQKFDEGTLYPTAGTKEDEWIPIKEQKKSHNIAAPSKRSYTVKVDMDNMKIMFSTGGATRTPWSGTLPVMFISTENNVPITSKDTYLQASYYLDPMEVEGVEAVGSADEQQNMQIRGRGNYTWVGFDKKPYRIKLEKKTALMGMEKSKHFALLAHADDSAAGLRNALGFAASEELGMPWTPATAPLEVVLNGDYIGLYWLTETVRVDKDRVDVVEQADNAVDDVDGGWLVEIDNYNSDPHVTVKSFEGNKIWFTYKSPEILSKEQESYLQTAMQSIDDALASKNEPTVSSLVDFDILARYFIANQIMLDMESFHGSCYLNRQRGVSEKWKFGPVWDFGNAFAASRADKPRFIFDHPDFSQVWIGAFYAMPSFVDAVKKVWKSFLSEGPDALEKSLQQRAGQIAAAAISDGKRWPQYSHSDIASQSAKLKSYLEGSIEWLKKQWGSEAGTEPVIADQCNIRVEGSRLIIESGSDHRIPLTRLDGTTIMLNLKPGTNIFNLPPGFYVVQGKKFLL